jgi:hypothetical protein
MKVFLSYAEADRKVAQELATGLREAGLRIWFAEDEVFPGDNWALEVGKALKQSDAMIVLISPQSMKSDWVLKEIEFALGAQQYQGRLIPVIVKPTPEVPWILKRFPAVRIGKNTADAVHEVHQHVKHGFELAPAKA